ncbi:hypothetical protein [uncultured Thiothrix sp.]|uniref:tetratricopeptide repeat protein n=1 Tax=uncultured Thiothrix sp. TaxID=223185 RepID=UPI00260C1E71|nr:hypothetical protein [uncultured Thiothrix sp.]
MKIIIRNRPILLISQVLLASYLPIQLNTAQAANAALTEAPPPWAARQDAQVATPLPAKAAIQEVASEVTGAEATETLRQARAQTTNTNNNSIEQWYAQRQNYAAPAKSAPELKAKATQGDLNAQYALALQLRQDPSPENIAESLKLQEKAARGGHVEAQYGLGVLYSNGQYLAQDQRLANFWYTQAAKRGSEAAKLALGSLPTQTAVPVARAARAPQTVALSPTTNEVAQVTAVHHNDSMFAAGEPTASSDVPTMSAEEYAALETDTATSQEPTMTVPEASDPAPASVSRQARQRQASVAAPVATVPAVELAQPAEGAAGAEGAPELAAEPEAGDISVEHNESKVDLGNMSVQEVINTAQKGDMYAQLMLGALFEDGTDPAIPQDIKEAAKWYAKAAKQGYPKAQHNLALLYEDGRGVPQSYTEAAKWYAKAAKAGFSEAQNNLAVLYIMGNGVKQDRAQAEKLLTAAVGQGNENARRNLQKLLEGAAS